MAIITVTVIPAVILIIIYAITAVTVISEIILRFVFLLMSLPGANFVKNNVFVIPQIFAVLKNDVIWMVLSLRSVLERLVLKKYAECTSQRLKPTSGARVMILFLTNIDEH